MTRGDSARKGPNSTLEETFYDINKRSDKELEGERAKTVKLLSVCLSAGPPLIRSPADLRMPPMGWVDV